MTQTAPARLPATAHPPVTAPPVQRRATPVAQRGFLDNLTTPTLLRLLLAVSIIASLLFGGVALTSLVGRASALGEATRHTAQLTRIQAIQAHLLSADATATNAFLIGGLESPTQRSAYAKAMEEVARLVPEAGEAQPADRDALRTLNAEVVTYAATMEQARANNRQGFPVGGAYLTDAGEHLRGRALPILDSLVATNSARANAALASGNAPVVTFVGVLAVVAVATTAVITALVFRRIINPGLAIALGLLLLALVIAGSAHGSTDDTLTRAATRSLKTARAAGTARVHAYDAKAYESLTLIARSRGGETEAQWALASLRARRALQTIPDGRLRTQLQQSWTGHVVSHRKVREHDFDGRWDRARDTATGTGPGSSNATFDEFDRRVTDAATSSGRDAVTQLRTLRPPLWTAAGAVAVLTLGAIAAACVGITRRLKEYA